MSIGPTLVGLQHYACLGLLSLRSVASADQNFVPVFQNVIFKMLHPVQNYLVAGAYQDGFPLRIVARPNTSRD